PPTIIRLGALLAIVAGLAVLVWAGFALTVQSSEPQLRGLVTNVVARDIGHAESITVRAADGREARFQVDPAVEWTPGHLREHMTFGEPVTVYYRQEGSGLLAVRVTD
ncbi:MAG: hypothetical protein ACRDJN_25335, partial [Chloroflexota bacterium]